MEDVESLGFCSPSYIPFSNIKNEEYSDIENLLTSDTIESEDSHGYKPDNISSKKQNSKNSEFEKNISQLQSKKQKQNHCEISAVNNPFMSARQVSRQPLSIDQSEETDECDIVIDTEDDIVIDSEDECSNQCLEQERDVSCKPSSKLPAYKVDHQKVCHKGSSHKDNETKVEKIKLNFGSCLKDNKTKAEKVKPVFGRPNKKTVPAPKNPKPPQANVSNVKSHTKKNKKKDTSEIDLDDPKSLSDPTQCIIIDEDEESFCLSAKVCSKDSSQKNNEEEEQIVPNFSFKKTKSKTKPVKPNTTNGSEDIKNPGPEKLKKKRSLTEISSAVLNSEHPLQKDSNKNNTYPTEKKSKEKKQKLKNSTEKSDTCTMIKEDHWSSPEKNKEKCNIPKKKRKKLVDKSSLADQHKVENNGPLITNVRSLADDVKPNLNNTDSLCSSPKDVQPTLTSPTSTDELVDHEDKLKKRKKKKSKDGSPEEESELNEKPAKKQKKKKKENPVGNEKVKVEKMSEESVLNVKVERMLEEIVHSSDESEDEERCNVSEEVDFPATRDSGSDKEEEGAKCKPLEKSEEPSSVKRKDDKSKKKDFKKPQQKCFKEKPKKKCSSSDVKKVRCKKFCMQDREILDTGTWVQCTNSECLKWRYLLDVQDPITVPMLWTCDMNPDSKQNDCSFPEISLSNEDVEEFEFIYTKYTEGTVVWARVDGYPWWPGMVEMDPDRESYFDIETENSMYPKFYHVVFFGKKVSRAWVAVSNIAPFTESKPPPPSKGTIRPRTQEINCAEKLAVKALQLPIKTRLKMFSFSSRYKGSWADCNCHACFKALSTTDDDNGEEDGCGLLS